MEGVGPSFFVVASVLCQRCGHSVGQVLESDGKLTFRMYPMATYGLDNGSVPIHCRKHRDWQEPARELRAAVVKARALGKSAVRVHPDRPPVV